MCLDRTQCRQGSPDIPDTTRCGAGIHDVQDKPDEEFCLGESGHKTTVSDAGHLFADECGLPCLVMISLLTIITILEGSLGNDPKVSFLLAAGRCRLNVAFCIMFAWSAVTIWFFP